MPFHDFDTLEHRVNERGSSIPATDSIAGEVEIMVSIDWQETAVVIFVRVGVDSSRRGRFALEHKLALLSAVAGRFGL